MPVAGPHGTGIMNAGKENGAQCDPGNSGYPAPIHGNCWTHNRCSPGYRGKVMSPKYKFVGRHEIDAIFKFMGRRNEVGIKLKDFLSDEF